jgi:hypothetical protein
MEGGGSVFRILTGKPIRKRPLGRPMRRWEKHIRTDLEEIGVNRRLIRLRIGIIEENLCMRHWIPVSH